MQDQYFKIDGFRVRYRDSAGTGQTIVFIHGIGASLEIWSMQEALAAQGFRIITVDLPGHGLSALGDQPYEPEKFADFCWKFLDVLGVGNVVLVGNSMGGGISILMASGQPHRVIKLILANAATLGKFSPLPFRLMSLPILGGLMTKPSELAVKQQISSIFYEPEKVVTPEIRAVITRNVMNTSLQKAFLATIRLMTGIGGQRQFIIDRAHAALKSLSMPILFLHGRQDIVLPVQHSVDAQKMTKNSNLIILENCGHTPQLEKSAELNSELIKFLGA